MLYIDTAATSADITMLRESDASVGVHLQSRQCGYINNFQTLPLASLYQPVRQYTLSIGPRGVIFGE